MVGFGARIMHVDEDTTNLPPPLQGWLLQTSNAPERGHQAVR